uniref:ATP synthase subunit a n=1 Tax=Sphaerobolus stellatus TaxID=68786 RepID=A0A7D4Z8R1_9AGAM|nr:ATP synthase F0 subunit a [Sphaerobolus stellatus]
MILVHSPLEQFEVINLISLNLPVLGYFNITLTNLALYSFIVLFVVIILHLSFKGTGSNNTKLIPSKWNIALESSYASISAIVREQIGVRNEIYLPFIYSLFFFILISNLIGNTPYSFTITTSIILAVGLSFTIFIGVTLIGLFKHGIHFFSFFIPSGTPLALVPLLVLIEVTSYLARALSLGVRLFANMCAGHTLLKILSTFLYQLFSSSLIIGILTLIPFSIFISLIGLEIAVSIIQAYVFILLTCSYIRDSIQLH